ncbi:kelch repeat-containing protein isoform X2 [Lepisosteus oculatus]|uniref:kelch repeat-containing protein isoform X2 n=1 Tax=Lepisosteus oculatus TaxID=7918 RepID=UPI0035F523D5
MGDLAFYVVFGTEERPRKLWSDGACGQFSVGVPAVPPELLVVFGCGEWAPGGAEVAVELRGPGEEALPLGKLTPHCRCLLWEPGRSADWEKWASKTGSSGLSLRLRVQGEATTTPPSGRAKRKRGQLGWEEGQGQENVPPSVPPAEAQRRVRSHPRPGHTRPFTPVQPCRPEGKSKAPVCGAEPSGRWGHTLCPIGSQTAILIGGQGSRMQFCKDPMWKLCTEDLSWVAAETIADGPTPDCRIGHTATFDPEKKRIYVFGGSKNKKWFNDVHILDTVSWRWTMVEAQGKVPPLAYHTCSLFRGELFVLGGVFPRPHPEPDGCSDSLYIFNPELGIWYQPIVLGDRPAPRSGHSACVIRGKIYIFGGWDTPICYNDTHALDLGLMEFSAVEVRGAPPSPRSWHGSAVLSGGSFLVHGGYDGHRALNDSFVFDTESSTWTAIVHPLLTATPRAGHTIVALGGAEQDPADPEGPEGPEPRPHALLVFGGGDNEGAFFSDRLTLKIDELLGQ